MIRLNSRATCLLLALTLAGCGGGGGGGGSNGIPPPAPPPVCFGLQSNVQSNDQPQIGGGDPRIIVPATTQRRSVGASLWAHTDHLIWAPSLTRASAPSGLTPLRVTGAYGVPGGAGSGAIAIVDAFNAPTILNDFNVFSTTFALPVETSLNATSSGNTVFQVVYASGKPVDDAGWAQESSLDTQWTHAMAPGAKIFLVEAASNSLADLMTAVSVAEGLPGVRQVSMSFGVIEDACSLANYDSVFTQSGVTYFASCGDVSGERDFPAESGNVVGVGGTTLSVSNTGQWLSEAVWNGTGGGASKFEPRPPFQDQVAALVGRYRGDADIAADADPQTGLSVYDSTPLNGKSGWLVFGGTSAATALIAGIANASGASHTSSQDQNTTLYAGIGGANFHDIKSGSSGSLSARVGWDFPTGVGTPNGVGGF